MKSMRAVVYQNMGLNGTAEVLEVNCPIPGPDEVLVRVHASGLNRADLLQLRGLHNAPEGSPANIPGIEFAGVVEKIGEDVSSFTHGQRVFGIVGGGAHAEYVVVREGLLAPVPEKLDMTQAAAVPESFITAYDALFVQAKLKHRESVLIHAAAGGVGTACVQLAKYTGCMVVGTTRTPDKLPRLTSLGVDVALDTADGKFAEKIMQKTNGRGVDVCIDLIGGAYFAENLIALNPKGRLILVGLLGGIDAPLVLETVISKRLSIIGTELRHRSIKEKIVAVRRFEHFVIPLLSHQLVHSIVSAVYPLEEFGKAHEHMKSGNVFGKILLSMV